MSGQGCVAVGVSCGWMVGVPMSDVFRKKEIDESLYRIGDYVYCMISFI